MLQLRLGMGNTQRAGRDAQATRAAGLGWVASVPEETAVPVRNRSPVFPTEVGNGTKGGDAGGARRRRRRQSEGAAEHSVPIAAVAQLRVESFNCGTMMEPRGRRGARAEEQVCGLSGGVSAKVRKRGQRTR